MRGHWESQTRRLNKHYQSGGPMAPSPDWQWMAYKTGGSCLPFRFEHDDESLGPYEEAVPYYNKLWNGTNGVYGGVTTNTNFSACMCLIGPMSRKYDEMYVSGYFGTNMTAAFRTWYENEVANHQRPTLDPAYLNYPSLFGNDEHNLYKDLNMRYVKFKTPKYTYAPAYYYGSVGSMGSLGKALSKADYPIFADFRVSAKACKAITFNTQSGSVRHRQQIRLRHEFIDEYGADTYEQKNIFTDDDDVAGASIYDQELLGLSYRSAEVSLRVSGEQTPTYKTYEARVYSFIYNGEYYVDQRVHLFDPVTEEELTDEEVCYLDNMRYPSILAAYMYGQAYVQSDNSFAAYPSYNQNSPSGGASAYHIDSLNDGTAEDFVSVEKIKVLPVNGVYGTDTTLPFIFSGYPSRNIVKSVEEVDFWGAESAWHTAHGGTPYLTPEEE